MVEKVSTARGKWKVRFLDDPYPGLEEYVRSAALVCRWGDVKKVQSFELRLDRLQQHSDGQWPGRDHPLDEAVDEILSATGEDIWRWKGILHAETEALDRLRVRAGALANAHGFEFEQDGSTFAPFDAAVDLTRAFAAAEPGTVLDHIDLLQRRYELAMREPGNAHLEPLVNRWRASWALVRQWAGYDAAMADRDSEIERLRALIQGHLLELGTEYPLSREPDGIATKLERGLKGG